MEVLRLDLGNTAGVVGFSPSQPSSGAGQWPRSGEELRRPILIYHVSGGYPPGLDFWTFIIPLATTTVGARPSTVQDQATSSLTEQPQALPLARDQRLRHRELEWLRNNRDALIQYLGNWIVIEDNRLVAAHHDYSTALQAARDLGIRTPFIFKLSEEFVLTGFD